MLLIDPEKEKQLTFSLNLEGASSNNIRTYFNIGLGTFDIRIPMVVENDKAKVIIPSLKKFGNFLPESSEVSVTAFVDDKFFVPFRTIAKIKKIMEVKTEIIDEEDTSPIKEEKKVEEKCKSEHNPISKEEEKVEEKCKSEHNPISKEEEKVEEKRTSKFRISLDSEMEIEKPKRPKKSLSRFASRMMK